MTERVSLQQDECSLNLAFSFIVVPANAGTPSVSAIRAHSGAVKEEAKKIGVQRLA
jgi:hypothetical protein